MVPQRVMGVLLLLLTAVAWVAADTMVMRDGRSFDSVRVDGFQTNGAGGVFMVRMLENGAPSPQAHGVEASLVERIEFREAVDTGALPQGRIATMIMADGRMHAVTVEHAYPRPEGVTFHVRQQGVPYGGASHDVVSTRLRGLDLTGAMAAAAPTPVPTPEAVVTGGFDGERMYSSLDETDGSEDSSWDEDEDSSDLDSDSGGFGPLDRFGGAALMGMGIGIVIVAVLIAMVIQSVLIWIFVVLSAKVCKVQDFSLLKAYGTAWLMILVTLLAIPLLCVPFVGIFLFLAGWYFMTRAVIMGMMEVQESQAFMVILTYILLQIGVNVLLYQFQ